MESLAHQTGGRVTLTKNHDRSAPAGARIFFLADGAAGILALGFAYYARSWQSFSALRDICPVLFCDFVDYYYPMGEAAFRSSLPVDGFLYSPFIAVLLAAFPPLGLDTSLVLWGILQALFVSFYVHLFRRLVPAGRPIQLLFVALTLTSYPLLLNVMGGQVSVVIMVALLGTLVLHGRGLPAAASALFAFAVSFKFFPIVFLAPFAARRDVRFLVLAALACGALLVVMPGLLLGGDATLRFYDALLDAFRDSGWVDTNPHSQFFPHVALRMTGASGEEARGLRSLLIWLAAGVAAANAGLIVLVQRARLRHAHLWSFQVVCLTIPFILKTSWPHDFVFLPVTQAFLAWRLLEDQPAAPGTDVGVSRPRDGARRAPTPRARIVVTAALVLSAILSNVFFYGLVARFVLYGQLAFLFWANLLLLVGCYVMLLSEAWSSPASVRSNLEGEAS